MSSEDLQRWIAFLDKQIQALFLLHCKISGSVFGILDVDAAQFLFAKDDRVESAISEFIRAGAWPTVGASALMSLYYRATIAKSVLLAAQAGQEPANGLLSSNAPTSQHDCIRWLLVDLWQLPGIAECAQNLPAAALASPGALI